MILRKISTHAERSVTQDDLQPTNEDLVVDILRQEFVESSHVQHIVDGLLNWRSDDWNVSTLSIIPKGVLKQMEVRDWRAW